MADTEEVPENSLRSKKDKKKRKYKRLEEINASDEYKRNPDLSFKGGTGHSVYGRHGLHHSHLDYLKSVGPQLEKHKDELIGLLSSTMKDEQRTILEEQYHSSIELYTCISLIGISIGVVNMPAELPPDEEAEEALLKQPVFTPENRVLSDTSAESESSGGSYESGLKALIKNLEKQMRCIAELIHFLEVDGSTRDNMDPVITRLVDLLEEKKERSKPFVGCEVYHGD